MQMSHLPTETETHFNPLTAGFFSMSGKFSPNARVRVTSIIVENVLSDRKREKNNKAGVEM